MTGRFKAAAVAAFTSNSSVTIAQRWRLGLFAAVLTTSLSAYADVPFAGELATPIDHYNRASAWLATAGAPAATDMAALKAAGFVNIIDLRRSQEGTAASQAAAEAAGLQYLNLPLGRERPDAETLAQFNAWVQQHQGENTLLHCASGNRAGTLWALHLLSRGVPAAQAVEQGLAAGMASNRSTWIVQQSADQAGTDRSSIETEPAQQH